VCPLVRKAWRHGERPTINVSSGRRELHCREGEQAEHLSTSQGVKKASFSAQGVLSFHVRRLLSVKYKAVNLLYRNFTLGNIKPVPHWGKNSPESFLMYLGHETQWALRLRRLGRKKRRQIKPSGTRRHILHVTCENTNTDHL
jgi:hypothetical protein